MSLYNSLSLFKYPQATSNIGTANLHSKRGTRAGYGYSFLERVSISCCSCALQLYYMDNKMMSSRIVIDKGCMQQPKNRRQRSWNAQIWDFKVDWQSSLAPGKAWEVPHAAAFPLISQGRIWPLDVCTFLHMSNSYQCSGPTCIYSCANRICHPQHWTWVPKLCTFSSFGTSHGRTPNRKKEL